MTDYIKQLRSAATASVAASIIDQCYKDGDLTALLHQLDHDYIIDGASRGYMAALVSLHHKRGLVLDLRDGSVICKNPPSADAVSHDTLEAAYHIMEDLFLSGADMD